MNAYELADELKACIDDGSTDLVCVCGAVNMLRQQADRIAELENEITFRKGIYKDLCNVIDEYKKLTPQTKPLSDEEIWSFADMVLENSDVIGFARAIEERHGIK